MKNKTFNCPYLTAADKRFLKYEQKVYKQNFKMLLEFHKKHEKLLKRTDNEAEDYDNAVYSSLCFNTGSDVFYALTLTHIHFVDDICDYFSITRGIKELNSEELTMEEVINETEMLTLDEVFDKYILKYLEEKDNN
jgi:hypothetical protein